MSGAKYNSCAKCYTGKAQLGDFPLSPDLPSNPPIPTPTADFPLSPDLPSNPPIPTPTAVLVL